MSSDAVDPWKEEPGVGRAFVVGATVGTVVSFVAVAAAGVVGGLGTGASIGLAAFVAFWGGLGFGGMMGGVAGIIRMDASHAADDAAADRTERDEAGSEGEPPFLAAG